jgi:uncharacterized protein (TIGR02284 family)
MNLEKVKNALQDLIIRLQDAEEGYREIIKADISFLIKTKLESYANERHQMHREIEKHLKALGETPEVYTSFLGDIHRKFISLKLEYVNDNIPSIINEIERGSRILISDYTSVLELEMPSNIMGLLSLQKSKIEKELDAFLELKENFQAIEA